MKKPSFTSSRASWHRLTPRLFAIATALMLGTAPAHYAFALEKVDDATLNKQIGGGRFVNGGNCANGNPCGTPVGCRVDPGNSAQCAEDVDLQWFTCDNQTAPPNVPVCVFPKTRNAACFIRVFYPSSPTGCHCTSGTALVGLPPGVLGRHNTCK